VIFLVSGLLPLLTLLWIRAIDRPNMNPFLAMWGVSVGTVLVFYFAKYFLGELVSSLASIVS
jgi:hypothetical protein